MRERFLKISTFLSHLRQSSGECKNIYNSEPRHQGVVKVNVPAKGTGSYTSWVNSPNCDLCGGTMYLDYNGIDANGHSINVSKQFILEK